MRKLRWGVLSTAKIATEKVIPAMQRGTLCEIVAIASRDLAKAETAARRLGISKAYGTYEALLEDGEIEAIYNPLPNHMHVPWTIAALAAGKHVLCEKPVAMNAEQARELAEAAQRHRPLKVMEAFMYRHHPQWQRVCALLAEGRIGELRAVQSFFSFYNDDPANIRNLRETGGGALMDIGCYCVSYPRLLFGAEPERVLGCIEYDPRFQVDRLSSGILDFGSGTATFTCSTRLQPYQRTQVLGTQGRIEIEIPCNAPNDRPCRIWLQRGAEVEELTFEICDQYTLQGDRFAEAVLSDSEVPTPLTDAVANMRVLDALVHSHEQKTWVAIEPD